MTEFRIVTDTFAVAPQISVADLVQAKAQGYELIVNNRPDGEAPDQTEGEVMRTEALALGLDYVAIPITGGPTVDQARAMAEAVDEAGGKVLAYCRSGTRSINTWALGQALTGQKKSDELIRLGAAAGYDLRPLLG